PPRADIGHVRRTDRRRLTRLDPSPCLTGNTSGTRRLYVDRSTAIGSQSPGAPGAALLDDHDQALLPKLDDDHIAHLAPHGQVRPTAAGEVLFQSGDLTYDVLVVLEGTVSILVGSGSESHELVTQTPRDLMVELNLFTGEGSGATGIVREAGSVLAIPASEFRELVGRDLTFG